MIWRPGGDQSWRAPAGGSSSRWRRVGQPRRPLTAPPAPWSPALPLNDLCTQRAGARRQPGRLGRLRARRRPPEQAGAGVHAPAQRRTPAKSAPFMGNGSPWEPAEQAVSSPAGSERPSRGGDVGGEPWSTAPDRILPPAPPLRRARGGGPSPPESRSRHAFFHRWLVGWASRSNGAPSGWAMCEPSLMGRAAFGATLEAQAAPFYGGGKEAASPAAEPAEGDDRSMIQGFVNPGPRSLQQ